MPPDPADIQIKAEAEVEACDNIARLAGAVAVGKTTDGTSLHADTLATMLAKVPGLKAALTAARTALDTAMTP